ncbi:MAG TPA: hypothetical protein PK826_04260 [Anaerolineae bacterium]|nr:hypothetical protein [Ardenticatenia bacterium]MBK8539581.1 hypothetical protein [Ardenticatenia bacterium]HQZ70533.1 hypothetical protein [Anaerolineae bacterium]
MPTILLAPDLVARGIDTQPLQSLRDHGLSLVLPEPGSAPLAGGPGTPPASAADPASVVDLVSFAELLRRHPSPVFYLSGEWTAVQVAESLGARPILILNGRTVDDVVGEAEAESKTIPIAADLTIAGRYLDAELTELARLGPFRFAQPPLAVAPSRPPALSRSELSRLFALIVLAGLTFALGLAYLLQEAYQSIAFPKALQWPVRFLTLQWIPQTLRGLMFLLIGMAIGFAVTRLLSRLSRLSRLGRARQS